MLTRLGIGLVMRGQMESDQPAEQSLASESTFWERHDKSLTLPKRQFAVHHTFFLEICKLGILGKSRKGSEVP